jgi:hypothetical protein
MRAPAAGFDAERVSDEARAFFERAGSDHEMIEFERGGVFHSMWL